MCWFDECLSCATEKIEEGYFYLCTAGQNSVMRERVYCYELYHQMRNLWPRKIKHILNAEIDKRSNHLVPTDSIPDFLIHIPGDMDRNYLIMEVKSAKCFSASAALKDIKTMSVFIEQAKYRRAVYLIYGSLPKDKIYQCTSVHVGIFDKDSSAIEIWVHEKSGHPAKPVGILSKRGFQHL